MSLGRWDEATEVIEHALALSPPRQPTGSALRSWPASSRCAAATWPPPPTRRRPQAPRSAASGRGHRGQYQLPLARLDVELCLAEGKPATRWP